MNIQVRLNSSKGKCNDEEKSWLIGDGVWNAI